MNKLLLLAMLSFSVQTIAQVSVKVYPTMGHKVGDVTHFARDKYIVMHSSLTDREWDDELDHLDYLLNDCDVYLGRDNGSMGWNFNAAKEDPNRKGYALLSGDKYSIAALGAQSRKNWNQNFKHVHKYDGRSDMMVGGQISWCWPKTKTRPYWDKAGGYESASGEAVGEYMGLYLNHFYRKDGELYVLTIQTVL